MATKKYTTRIHLELDTINAASCIVYIDGQPVTFDRVIQGPTEYKFDTELSSGTHCLEIKHLHKQPTDPDTALIIKSITFNDITSDKFVWEGIYYPEYPKPWAAEQGHLPQELTATKHLGWNGVWRLTFTAPIFTWIHTVENLGWIYV